MVTSQRAPWYRSFLQRHAKFLFKKCPDEQGEEITHTHANWHWFWDTGCICQDESQATGRVRGWR